MRLDEEKIRKQAKQIMDEFMKALEKVKQEELIYGLEKKKSTREPEKPDESGFRERMFRNAPKKKGDHIIAERKHW